MSYQRRFFPLPQQSFFLFGPRGTGKSTWLRHRLPDALFVDLLDPSRFRELTSHPERLGELVRAAPDRAWVVIDEVQRIPELLHVVHDLMETGPPRRYVLTGSSARKLRRGGVDLLGGRALFRTFHPFLAAELDTFELDRALKQGLVPLVVDAPDPDETLRAYATLYLEEEVQAEGLVRDLGSFARFLEAVSFSHGSVLNVTSIGRDCHIGRKTVAGYLEILEDLLLAFRLPVFTRRARRQTTARPKLYLFDAGVYRSLRPSGPLDRPAEIDGAAFEGLVAQHLRAWLAYSRAPGQLTFWRTATGREIDFIVYGEIGFWAIEVKHSVQIRPKDLASLKVFHEDYPECRPILLYRGRDRRVVDGVWCVPAEDFLRNLLPDRPLDHAWWPEEVKEAGG